MLLPSCSLEEGFLLWWHWGREGEKSRRAIDTPALSSPNFKLCFCALFVESDTNKTQGVLSEEQVPLLTWLKGLL